ncbi:MAG: WxcM-like domain-containing protein [Chloroflexota bacterium]
MSSIIEITELNRVGADERGWVLEPISDAELSNREILNVHIVCAEPGSVRGNHYHTIRRESICILSGTFLCVAVDNATEERLELTAGPERNLCLTVPRNVGHALKNIGQDKGYLLCYSDKPFNPDNPDTVRKVVLD